MKDHKKFSFPFKSPFTPDQWAYLSRKYHLSNRELQVAICVCSGCDNKQIAKNLKIEIGTAKNMLHLLYVKVGVSNKTRILLKFFEDVSS